MAAPKDCSSRSPATHLSLACHNQGVRLKIKKAVYVIFLSVGGIDKIAKTFCRKRKAASGSDNDLEGGRQITDQQKRKYRLLMPNDHNTQLGKQEPEPRLEDPRNTTRDDKPQQRVQSSDKTCFPSIPNQRQYIQGPSLHMNNPLSWGKDGEGVDQGEHQMDSRHINRFGRKTSGSDSCCGPVPSSGVAIVADHQHQGRQARECNTSLPMTSGSWLGEHQKTRELALSVETPLWDSRRASKRASAQPQPISPASPTFNYQSQFLPGAALHEEWDCLNASIPSPTGVWLPLQTDSGFAGPMYEEWAGTCG